MLNDDVLVPTIGAAILDHARRPPTGGGGGGAARPRAGRGRPTSPPALLAALLAASLVVLLAPLLAPATLRAQPQGAAAALHDALGLGHAPDLLGVEAADGWTGTDTLRALVLQQHVDDVYRLPSASEAVGRRATGGVVTWPWRLRRWRGTAGAAGAVSALQWRSARPDAAVTLAPEARTRRYAALMLAARGRRGRVRLEGGRAGAAAQHPVAVDRYPDGRPGTLADRYFYDRLAPTFGHAFSVARAGRRTWGTLRWDAPARGRLQAGLRVRHARYAAEQRLRYVNEGDARLAGERRVDAPLAVRRSDVRMTAAYRPSPRAALRAVVAWTQRRGRLAAEARDVPVDDGVRLDVERLGRAAWRLAGPAAGVGGRVRLHRALTAAVAVQVVSLRVRVRGDASTPVLGFAVGEAVPVVHRFDGTLAARVRLHDVAVRLQHRPGRRLRYAVEVGRLQGRACGRVTGEADMAVGIVTEPLDERACGRAGLWRVGLAPSVRLGARLRLGVHVTQLVPVLPRGGGDVLPAASRGRASGGRLHAVTLTYML